MNIHEKKVSDFFIVVVSCIILLLLFLLMIDGITAIVSDFRDVVLAIGGGIAGGLTFSYFEKANK